MVLKLQSSQASHLVGLLKCRFLDLIPKEFGSRCLGRGPRSCILKKALGWFWNRSLMDDTLRNAASMSKGCLYPWDEGEGKNCEYSLILYKNLSTLCMKSSLPGTEWETRKEKPRSVSAVLHLSLVAPPNLEPGIIYPCHNILGYSLSHSLSSASYAGCLTTV